MYQGLKLMPFTANPHSTTGVNLSDTISEIALTNAGEGGVLLIDNTRGSTEAIIEFWDNPLDSNSFRIPPYSSMIMSVPKRASPASFVRAKRPAGSVAAYIYVTQGFGF